MLVGDSYYRSIWHDNNDVNAVSVIDQRELPFSFVTRELRSVEDVFNAIQDLTLRGAPLIGAAGAYGIWLATLEISGLTGIQNHIENAARYIKSGRPTAVNLAWAVDKIVKGISGIDEIDKLQGESLRLCTELCEEEVARCRKIGENGLEILKGLSRAKDGSTVNILTHCNAGWLACIDYGTALAPVYLAHEEGIPVHVWVDETRPVNQGARLTMWELENAGIPCTLITDNTGGYLMQQGQVDIVITGSDRTSATGDVANKIGTYLKALAAFDNKVPFWVAFPSSTVDFGITDAMKEIPVEMRSGDEVTTITGTVEGQQKAVRITTGNASALNPAFDITPARLISGFITDKGICGANENDLKKMFSDK